MLFCVSAEDEGATPVKRRRMSSDDDAAADGAAPLCVASTSSSSALPTCGDAKADHQEALTPTSTSDTETRDSSSLIDPGTEQDPPSPDSNPATSGNLDSSPKEEKMEASSSSSSSFSSSSSSLMQEAGEGFVQGEEPEPQRHVGTAEEHGEEAKKGAGTSTSADEEKEKEAGSQAGISPAPPQLEETTLPSAMGLVGEGPESCSSHASSAQMSSDTPDMLDMLYRTVDAAIAIVTKLSTKGPPSS